jgi:hypothetical protein
MQQRPRSVLSNAQLVDIFAEKLNLAPDRKKSLIGNICFCDAMDEDGNGGMWSSKDDHVKGGRLGRDHTLSDVPNHFVRDWMLAQIDQGVNEVAKLDEDQIEAARRAILPDLTADEVSEYSKVLAKQREDALRAERAENGIPEADATPDEIRKCRLKRIMLSYGFEREKQAEVVLNLEDALEAVDNTVDLTPRVRPGVVRNYEKYGPIRRSVLFPHFSKDEVTRIENELSPPVQIDRDCDQIRLMIRRFCHFDKDWPRLCYQYSHYDDFGLDGFQRVLGISRQTLTAFLKKKGLENGDQSQAYELAWEFFKRRELLGYPLVKDEESASIRAAQENGSVGINDGSNDEPIKEMVRTNRSDLLPSKRKNKEVDPNEGRSKKSKTTEMPNRRRSERLKR